jgi:hypothetical protein
MNLIGTEMTTSKADYQTMADIWELTFLTKNSLCLHWWPLDYCAEAKFKEKFSKKASASAIWKPL